MLRVTDRKIYKHKISVEVMRTDQTYSRFIENDTITIRQRLNELPSQKKEISRRPEKVTLLKLIGVPALAYATALGAIVYINGMNYFKENPYLAKPLPHETFAVGAINPVVEGYKTLSKEIEEILFKAKEIYQNASYEIKNTSFKK